MEILQEWARLLMHVVRTHDYASIYVLLSVEEAGVPLPLPGDTVVAYAGYLVSKGKMIWWLILVAAIGASVTGSLPLYWLARSRGRPLLLRYGKFIHLTKARERRLEGWLQRNAGIAVFLGRLIPGLRVGTTAIAGVFEIPFIVYLTSLTLSAAVWWGFWLWLGSVIGRRLAPMLELSPISFVVTAVIVVSVVSAIFFLRGMAGAENEKEAPASLGEGQQTPVLEVTAIAAHSESE